MPVNSCSLNGKPGYKWGDSGKCYTYSPDNENSMKEAKKKALAQGIAIGDIELMEEDIDKEYEEDMMGELAEEEMMLAMALMAIAEKYGKFNEDKVGIWAGYESPEENDDKEIGVKCANCVLYHGDDVCDIIAIPVHPEGKCRFAVIPDGLVNIDDQEMEDEDDEEEIEDENELEKEILELFSQKELSLINLMIESAKKNSIEDVTKSLTEWFREDWVDISRPKPGGGFQPCGRSDASTGKYPKCVPAARAARMTPEQIASAVRRKRRAESTQSREGKKPIYVSTEKAETRNVPTNPALYARVKAEAKAKFDVYPSAYANAWLVREYKKRGGGYRTVKKSNFDDISKIDLLKYIIQSLSIGDIDSIQGDKK